MLVAAYKRPSYVLPMTISDQSEVAGMLLHQ